MYYWGLFRHRETGLILRDITIIFTEPYARVNKLTTVKQEGGHDFLYFITNSSHDRCINTL